ncbi:MAG TPA: hypothetical protein VFX05_11390 [Casimicrobiaceae bacterium]|nr:hypothetical protein [Casimicrobiaceae bacterium]
MVRCTKIAQRDRRSGRRNASTCIPKGQRTMETIPRNIMHSAQTLQWWSIGAWIRLAIAGGLLVPAGVVMIADGDAGSGVLAMLAGAAVAFVATWRAARALNAADPTEAPARPASSAAPATASAGSLARSPLRA